MVSVAVKLHDAGAHACVCVAPFSNKPFAGVIIDWMRLHDLEQPPTSLTEIKPLFRRGDN